MKTRKLVSFQLQQDAEEFRCAYRSLAGWACYLGGLWRLWWLHCPGCNDDAPATYDCELCAGTPGWFPPRRRTLVIWRCRWEALFKHWFPCCLGIHRWRIIRVGVNPMYQGEVGMWKPFYTDRRCRRCGLEDTEM